ncbi:MAG: SDR family oxidoreductase [Firmicutes bacterium]|nr:SDR family oxidoreductase [Bacillota bacterium]
MRKVALVTGAGSGIGRAIVYMLAKQGIKVYANARNEEKISETISLCKDFDVEPLLFDVTDPEMIREKIDSLERLDYLVNNAGKSIVKKEIAEYDQDDWDSILNTNVKGYFYVTQAALKKMSGGAAIVNMSSGAAKTGGDFVSIPYSTSKGAINSLTICLARDLAKRGIRVNAVSPGFVNTPMLMLNGKPVDYYDSVIPLGKLGVPKDIVLEPGFFNHSELN